MVHRVVAHRDRVPRESVGEVSESGPPSPARRADRTVSDGVRGGSGFFSSLTRPPSCSTDATGVPALPTAIPPSGIAELIRALTALVGALRAGEHRRWRAGRLALLPGRANPASRK